LFAERDGRRMGEGWERDGRGMAEGWQRDVRGMAKGCEKNGRREILERYWRRPLKRDKREIGEELVKD